MRDVAAGLNVEHLRDVTRGRHNGIELEAGIDPHLREKRDDILRRQVAHGPHRGRHGNAAADAADRTFDPCRAAIERRNDVRGTEPGQVVDVKTEARRPDGCRARAGIGC